MSRKDDLKLLFNFMIELLREDEEVKSEVKEQTKELLSETPKEDESAKHILDVMKRAELMDKMRRTTIARPTLVPLNERDEDEIARLDGDRIETHKKEKGSKNIKEILTNAKDFMDDLETKKPITPSVPPSVLNEQENHLYAPISKSDVFEKIKK
jgi:hypothetical protein